MKVIYINRYKDEIAFIKRDDSIIMSGGQYCRVGFVDEQDKSYTMVDPSGGPYIALGTDMGMIHKSWNNLIVTKIEPDNENFLLRIEKKE